MKKHWKCLFWGFTLLAAGVTSGGAQQQVTLTAVADTLLQENINSSTSSKNRGTDAVLEVGTRSGRKQRMLVRFDLSSIPSGAEILSAELQLGRVSRANFSDPAYADIDKNVYAFRMLIAWVETEASWDWSQLNQTEWESPGAVGPADRAVQPTGGGNDTELRYPIWDVTSDVQLFADGTAEHFGWMMVGPEDEMIGSNTLIARFGTKEHTTESEWPKLTVQYQEAFSGTPGGYSRLLYPGDDGRLIYEPDANGNTLPDFSNAGYLGGGVSIPDVPARVTLYPSSQGDDTTRIQNAINYVGSRPLDENGFRGAVLLTRGTYRVGGSLHLRTSGVVLRGEGDGEDGTVIQATGTDKRDLIQVGGSGSWKEIPGTRKSIVDSYVPVGSRRFTVEETNRLEVGDSVIVHRPSTEEWISAIGMDEIPPRSDGLPVVQWAPGAYDLLYDRTIVAIEGNTITIDAPLVNALEERFGGGWIYKYDFPGRVAQVGVERLRAVSDHTDANDEDHAWNMVTFDAVRNAWARELTAVHFGFSVVKIAQRAKWITARDCSYLKPVSEIKGSRRYPFYITGQLSLVEGGFAEAARHDFATGGRTHGPNVFLRSTGLGSSADSGPHQRWATGTLYDNISVPNHDINVQNRLNLGSGQGWAGANQVIWNSTAKQMANQMPPTAQNWAIGVRGSRWSGRFPSYAEEGYWESHGTPVEPESLYERQLEERGNVDHGAGGLIAIVDFEQDGNVEWPDGAEEMTLPLLRRGVMDHRLDVNYRVSGTEWLDSASLAGSPVPAHAQGADLSLRLQPDRFRPESVAITIALVHGTGYSAGSAREIRLVVPPRPFDAWRALHFSGEQLSDSQVAGDEADPAGDGVPNLLKYAFGLSPWEHVDRRKFPSARLVEGHLEMTFPWKGDDPSLEYRVEVSSDLSEWHSGDEYTELFQVEDGGEYELLSVRDRTAMGGISRRYMRIRVLRHQ